MPINNGSVSFGDGVTNPKKVRVMTFTLSGFDHWTFQVVFYGSLLVLEAMQDDLRISAVLNPLDDTRNRAHQLISRPSCAVISRGY